MKGYITVVIVLFVAIWAGVYASRIQECKEPSHNQRLSLFPISLIECEYQCVSAINIVTTLWPKTKTVFTLLRIIPDTKLACKRMCAIKTIKKAVTD